MLTMWILTSVGIVVVMCLLVASTTFRCLSSSPVTTILQIGALVIFVVMFASLLIFFLSTSDDGHELLEEFTRKAKAKEQEKFMKYLASVNYTLKRPTKTTPIPLPYLFGLAV